MRSIEEAVPAEALSASLYKISLRRGETFAEKVLSAMREDFSGHIFRTPHRGARTCSASPENHWTNEIFC
jgi:6-phosphogluconate dehydrogenase (decarboxylating)